MSGKNDLADIARGQTLRLGTFEGQDIAIPVRPRAELGKRPVRFMRANPNGFEVVIRGRRIRVIRVR